MRRGIHQRDGDITGADQIIAPVYQRQGEGGIAIDQIVPIKAQFKLAVGGGELILTLGGVIRQSRAGKQHFGCVIRRVLGKVATDRGGEKHRNIVIARAGKADREGIEFPRRIPPAARPGGGFRNGGDLAGSPADHLRRVIGKGDNGFAFFRIHRVISAAFTQGEGKGLGRLLQIVAINLNGEFAGVGSQLILIAGHISQPRAGEHHIRRFGILSKVCADGGPA